MLKYSILGLKIVKEELQKVLSEMEHKRVQENTDQHLVDVLTNRKTNTELFETLMFLSILSL